MLSKSLEFLESAHVILNERYFEGALSKPIITVQKSPKAYGHFTCYKAWADDKADYEEINISAETLNRPLENTIATLLHEMVHQYCFENDIQDTSRGGTYHNKKFAEEAEKRGLIIEQAPKIGWSKTTPSAELVEFVKKKWKREISLHRAAEIEAPTKKKSSTRKYVCPCCGMSVRATKEVAIKCMECDMQLECEEE